MSSEAQFLKNKSASQPECNDALWNIYAQYWTYIRHVEEIRIKLIGLILTFSTISIAFIKWTWSDNGDLLFSKLTLVALTSFMFLSSVGVSFYFVTSKRNYNHYMNVIFAIENLCLGTKLISNDHHSMYSPVKEKPFYTSPFLYWLIIPVSIALAWSILLIYVLYRPSAH